MRELPIGESDKRLTIFCKDIGIIFVYAKGARKAKSKFLAASQLLTYADYVVAEGNQFFSMTQADILAGFYEIGQSYESLCYAQYILEICEKVIPNRTESNENLQLTLKTLQHINKNLGLQAVAVFVLRFLLNNGVAPEMGHCCICANKNVNSFFCKEGIICNDCKPKVKNDHLEISQNVRYAVNYILTEDLSQAFLFTVDFEVVSRLMQVAQFCFDRNFNVRILSRVK